MDLDGQLAGQEGGAGAAVQRSIVDDWLEPLPGNACGDDLEYDPAFHELTVVAAGKPESQFAAAEPPDWSAVHDQAAALFDRTRDLRVAVLWARAVLNLRGFASLPDSLRLLHGLLDQFWDGVHPALDPDDGDAFARVSTLASLADMGGLLGDLRMAMVVKHRAFGELRVRDVEVALDKLPPREDESPRTRGQITGLLSDLPELADRLRDNCSQASAGLTALYRLMTERFGFDLAVDIKPMKGMIDSVAQVVPEPVALAPAEAEGDGDEPEAGWAPDAADASPGARGGARAKAGLSGEIDTREDAERAIDMICAYLERTEPSNPAQLLLRRAQRLINKNFLQLVQELAPDALNEVARMMGVDPNSISADE
ncbi:MAG TPA: type VI secretion system protein TssA [Ideonella sp.]|nr:type VI secretion system protein TssA [Ideonella sp.]